MVSRKRLFDVFLSLMAASAAMAPSASMAGDWHRHHHRHYDEPIYIAPNGLPTHIRGLGTFVGGISAVRIRGVGNYFYIEPNVASQMQNTLRPRAKIVYPANGAGCSMENGVCVIRP